MARTSVGLPSRRPWSRGARGVVSEREEDDLVKCVSHGVSFERPQKCRADTSTARTSLGEPRGAVVGVFAIFVEGCDAVDDAFIPNARDFGQIVCGGFADALD